MRSKAGLGFCGLILATLIGCSSPPNVNVAGGPGPASSVADVAAVNGPDPTTVFRGTANGITSIRKDDTRGGVILRHANGRYSATDLGGGGGVSDLFSQPPQRPQGWDDNPIPLFADEVDGQLISVLGHNGITGNDLAISVNSGAGWSTSIPVQWNGSDTRTKTAAGLKGAIAVHILRPLNRYNNGVLFLVSGEGAKTKVTRVADTPGGEVASAGPDRLILTGAGQSRLQLVTSSEPFATWTNLDLVALLGLRSGEQVRGTSSPASDNQSAYVGVVTGTPDPKMIENDTNRRAWVVRIDRDGTPTIAYQAQTDALPVVAARSGSVSVAIGRAIYSKLGASSWRTEPEAPAIVTSLTSTAKGLVAITTDGACGDQRNEECRPLSCNLTTDSYLLRPNGWQSIQLP